MAVDDEFPLVYMEPVLECKGKFMEKNIMYRKWANCERKCYGTEEIEKNEKKTKKEEDL